MKKIIYILLPIAIYSAPCYGLEKDNRVDYVKSYNTYAIQNMKMFKIPASITLAQGILESGSGNSELARKSNNHFGIKCGSKWSGGKTYHDDDAKGECFRTYESVLESYYDHSKFLTENRRYSDLFLLQMNDYKSWARGLSKAGYATNPNYANRLISIIEDLQLYSFDEAFYTSTPVQSHLSKKIQQTSTLNGIHITKVNEGGSYYKIAKAHNLTLRQIHKYNDTKYGNHQILEKGDFVYLGPKRFKSKKKNFIILSENTSPLEVSQKEGVKLKSLMRKNHISSPDEQLRKGEKVFLR